MAASKGQKPIRIKPSHRGTFTAAAHAHHLSPDQFDNVVLAHPDDYSKKERARAQFAENAEHWRH